MIELNLVYRQAWKRCNEKRARYSRLLKEPTEWMEEAERTLAHAKATAGGAADRGDKSRLTEALEEQKQIERQVSERNKEVTDLAVIGKEMMNRSSAQEHVDIQAQVGKGPSADFLTISQFFWTGRFDRIWTTQCSSDSCSI